jgi:hypothetical protein
MARAATNVGEVTEGTSARSWGLAAEGGRWIAELLEGTVYCEKQHPHAPCRQWEKQLGKAGKG